MSLERHSLKKKVYTPKEVETWLKSKQDVNAEIVRGGEPGEAFAVYFFATSKMREKDMKHLVGQLSRLMDEDKPYSGISSVKLTAFKGKTAIRVGWMA